MAIAHLHELPTLDPLPAQRPERRHHNNMRSRDGKCLFVIQVCLDDHPSLPSCSSGAGRNRTPNLRFRKPVPYPLGHRPMKALLHSPTPRRTFVGQEGIEPPAPVCKTGMFPLHHRPIGGRTFIPFRERHRYPCACHHGGRTHRQIYLSEAGRSSGYFTAEPILPVRPFAKVPASEGLAGQALPPLRA